MDREYRPAVTDIATFKQGEGHTGVSILLETGRLAEAEDPIPMQLELVNPRLGQL